MADEKAISLVSTQVPQHVKDASNLGNENVKGEHLQTPRVKLLQMMSHEVDENHSEYLKDAVPGDMVNALTGDNYGKKMYVLNVHFTEAWVVWRRRDKGGGYIGSATSAQGAVDLVESQDGSPDDYETIQTQTHLLLRKNEFTGDIDRTPFLFDFAASKLRVSREWNTQLQKVGGDRFSALWEISSKQTQNRSGQVFQNLEVEYVGWAQDDDYEKAKELYSSVSQQG